MAAIKPGMKKRVNLPPTQDDLQQDTLSLPEPVPTTAAPEERRKGRRPAAVKRSATFATKVQPRLIDDVRRLAERDRITMGALIERAVERYEASRVQEAEKLEKRDPGESDDDLIKRAFRLDM